MNDLVVLAGRGDVGARTKLLEQLSPRLEKIVRRYAWIKGVDRDDLRQEACIAVMEGLERVDPAIGSSSEYLLKFARWRLLDCLKKIRRRKEDLTSEIEMEAAVPGPCAEAELLDDRLTDLQRRILSYLVQGYTWREVGDMMGFSAANISYHLKKIRKIYGENG